MERWSELELEREARIDDEGDLLCPWCESNDVYYTHDAIRAYDIKRVKRDGELIVIDRNPWATGDNVEPFNERIVCQACGEASRIPDDYATVFE